MKHDGLGMYQGWKRNEGQNKNINGSSIGRGKEDG